jgi:SPP1 gp7 family putative phage head morphogenesis protein
MKITAAKLEELGVQSGVHIVQGLPDLIAGQELALARIIASQVPDTFTIDWSRVSDAQLEAIVKRSTQQITSTLRPLPAEVYAGMKAELIRGVVTGTNPNQVARIMMKRFGTRFEGGLWRARTIARTEMLSATRDAALASRQENRAVLSGWRWLCSLSSRTCPACLSMNGRTFEIDEPGPDDHQNGRCTAVPVAKSWRELGIDADEPESQFPDAQAWFKAQTAQTQQQIMGKARLDALNSGKLDWGNLAVKRSNPGWRDSYHPRAVPTE